MFGGDFCRRFIERKEYTPPFVSCTNVSSGMKSSDSYNRMARLLNVATARRTVRVPYVASIQVRIEVRNRCPLPLPVKSGRMPRPMETVSVDSNCNVTKPISSPDSRMANVVSPRYFASKNEARFSSSASIL